MRLIYLPITLLATSSVNSSLLDSIYDNFLSDETTENHRSKRELKTKEERREIWRKIQQKKYEYNQKDAEARKEEMYRKKLDELPDEAKRDGRIIEPFKGKFKYWRAFEHHELAKIYNNEPWTDMIFDGKENRTRTVGRMRWDCPEDMGDYMLCQNQFGKYWKKAKWDKKQQLQGDHQVTPARWNYHEDYPEKESSWFTHPDYKDPNGHQKYYRLTKRHDRIIDGTATDYGLNRYYWRPACQLPNSGCEELGNANSTCECCEQDSSFHPFTSVPGFKNGCTIGWKQNCRDVPYTDENGETAYLDGAHQWCPESLEELQEVYSHTINDIDPDYLGDDFFSDSNYFFGLPIMQLWAKWLVYARWQEIGNFNLSENKWIRSTFPQYVYNRFNIGLGIQSKKYYKPDKMHMQDDKKGLTCAGDFSWASRIQKSDDFDNRKIFKGNGKYEHLSYYWNEDEGGYGLYLDYLKTDLKIGQNMGLAPASCSKVSFVIDQYGKGLGPTTDYPWIGDNGWDKSVWEWKIQADQAECGTEFMKNTQPMCVVSGADVPEAIKNAAIDIKAAGPLTEKMLKRQNDIQQVINNIELYEGIKPSIINLLIQTGGFLLCCCCCCQLPCCKPGGLCAKGGCLWESFACSLCKLVCYGGFCGWRCRKKIKDEEAQDKLEAERRKAEESDESSSSGSSSSDSD